MSAPAENRRYFGMFALAIALGVLILDFLAKRLVIRKVTHDDPIEVIGSFFEIVNVENKGVAFGLLSSQPGVAVVAALFVLLVLVVVLSRVVHRGAGWALAAGLLLGGAFANLLDRLGDGQVTDFISIGRWPSFNVADAAVTIGAVLLLALGLLGEKPQSEAVRHTGQRRTT